MNHTTIDHSIPQEKVMQASFAKLFSCSAVALALVAAGAHAADVKDRTLADRTHPDTR